MSQVRGAWNQLAEATLDLVVPQECAGCGTRGLAWCARCAELCAGPPLRVPAVVACRAACAHAGPAGRAVVAFKDAQVRRLAGPLAGMLAVAVVASLADAGSGDERLADAASGDAVVARSSGGRVRASAPGTVWLVPVPSRRIAVRTRGSDHTAVLAGRAAGQLRRSGIQAHRIRALEHVRASRDQLGLGRDQRRVNVAHTLRAREVPPGRIVLVDDVTTTGATLAESVRALGNVGRRVTCAATVTWSVPGPRHLAWRGPAG